MADGGPIIIGQANTASNPGNETSLSRNEGTEATVFVARNLNVGDGIHGEGSGIGVRGDVPSGGTGVRGNSGGFGVGVWGDCDNAIGVFGTSDSYHGVTGLSNSGIGVVGSGSFAAGIGVQGRSYITTGMQGISNSGYGVEATSDSGFGVKGSSLNNIGVFGLANSADGVQGMSDAVGVRGVSTRGSDGVYGQSRGGNGVHGNNISGGWGTLGEENAGVRGVSTPEPIRGPIGAGVRGIGDTFRPNDPQARSGVGVVGESHSNHAVFGFCHNPEPTNPGKVAGYFDGGIHVVNGNKSFKIDHPLEPENKYLMHTCVESSERKNVYDGVAQLDEDGTAWVELPEWFEALNGDFRYQLTAIGGSAPNLHVAEEVSENRFKMAGGQEGMKVCWQVTGSRKDPWAAANPFEVEQEKREEERGRYLDPSLYDAPEEQRVMLGLIGEVVEEERRPPEPPDIDFARLEEEHRRQIDELRRQQEEHRREMEELHQRRERQEEEEAPPEIT